MPSLQEQIDTKMKEMNRLEKELMTVMEGDIAKASADMDDAVRQIEMKDFAEMKAMAKVKDEVCQVLNTVVYIIFDVKPIGKDTWKIRFFDRDFLERLQKFNRDSVSETVTQKLDEHFSNPAVSAENMENMESGGPRMVKLLSKWLWAARSYAKLEEELKPKMEDLRTLHAELETLQREQALVG
mmetsp:Transcript_96783/g.118562  ORF Transcript_96783/g.118562 Transcript_96783/m.118562 type:complete len:184 (+) Transcript_96783:77-628(+)